MKSRFHASRRGRSDRFAAGAMVLCGAFAWAIFGLGEASCAGEFDSASLERIPAKMAEFVEKKAASGLVTVVGNRSGVVLIDARGLARLDGAVPMTPHTLFRIASMTKPITALAVMQLVEAGKISVDDPIEKHLPEFKGQLMIAAKVDSAVLLKKPARPAAVKDLLTHTSGLPGGYPPGVSDLYSSRKLSLAESTYLTSQRPLEFEPGSKWSYCNPGIDVLGRLVEVVSGAPFDQYLDDKVFRPLGMTSTTFFPTADMAAVAAEIYESKDGELKPVERPLVGTGVGAKHPIPAGGLYSNGNDLAKLAQCLLRGGELNGVRILSQERLAEMTTNHTGDLLAGFGSGMCFGYGFAVVKEPAGATAPLSAGTFGHGGAFGTQYWMDPKRDVFTILLIQRTGLVGGDGHEVRAALEKLAHEAVKR